MTMTTTFVCRRGFCWRSIGFAARRRGQLGVGTTTNHSSPQLVTTLRDVVEVSCGSEHTGAVTNDWRCHTWGSGCHGQLGTGVTDHPHKRPTNIVKLNAVRARFIACGGLHTAVLSHDGRVFTFGW